MGATRDSADAEGNACAATHHSVGERKNECMFAGAVPAFQAWLASERQINVKSSRGAVRLSRNCARQLQRIHHGKTRWTAQSHIYKVGVPHSSRCGIQTDG